MNFADRRCKIFISGSSLELEEQVTAFLQERSKSEKYKGDPVYLHRPIMMQMCSDYDPDGGPWTQIVLIYESMAVEAQDGTTEEK